MSTTSAGLLLHRRGSAEEIEVLLVHPGGPFWAKRDLGAWSVPKGEYGTDEDPWTVAKREFAEELGVDPPPGVPRPLGEVRQSGGKRVMAWAIEGDVDVAEIESNTFEMEWPPRSGRTAVFPEVDRAEWFPLDEAHRRINAAQAAFLTRLVERGGDPAEP